MSTDDLRSRLLPLSARSSSTARAPYWKRTQCRSGSADQFRTGVRHCLVAGEAVAYSSFGVVVIMAHPFAGRGAPRSPTALTQSISRPASWWPPSSRQASPSRRLAYRDGTHSTTGRNQRGVGERQGVGEALVQAHRQAARCGRLAHKLPLIARHRSPARRTTAHAGRRRNRDRTPAWRRAGAIPAGSPPLPAAVQANRRALRWWPNACPKPRPPSATSGRRSPSPPPLPKRASSRPCSRLMRKG